MSGGSGSFMRDHSFLPNFVGQTLIKLKSFFFVTFIIKLTRYKSNKNVIFCNVLHLLAALPNNPMEHNNRAHYVLTVPCIFSFELCHDDLQNCKKYLLFKFFSYKYCLPPPDAADSKSYKGLLLTNEKNAMINTKIIWK